MSFSRKARAVLILSLCIHCHYRRACRQDRNCISAVRQSRTVIRSSASRDSRISVIGKMGKPNYHAGKCGVIHFPDKSCALENVYSHPFAPIVPEYYIVSFSQDDRVIEADEWDSP